MSNSSHTTLLNTTNSIGEKSGNVYSSQQDKWAGNTQDQLLVLEPRIKVKRPPFYKVVMLNDDYTPMDFVVELLTSIFKHSQENAIDLMLQIHQKGSAIVGVYTRDVAETKVDLAITRAKTNEYPLQCVMEKE